MDLAAPIGCTDPELIAKGLLAILHPGVVARDRVTKRNVVSQEFLGIHMWCHSDLPGRIQRLKEPNGK
jgi:hypothetical protein